MACVLWGFTQNEARLHDDHHLTDGRVKKKNFPLVMTEEFLVMDGDDQSFRLTLSSSLMMMIIRLNTPSCKVFVLKVHFSHDLTSDFVSIIFFLLISLEIRFFFPPDS